MRNNNIIVAFRNEKISDTVIRMLSLEGINACAECTSGAEVRKQVSYLGTGILICGYNLRDTSIVSLIDDIPESFGVILIGNYSQISLCDNDRVFKLAVPLSKSDLIYSVTMLMNMEAKYRNDSTSVNIRVESEKKLIEEAKNLMLDKYNMTEEQAHRYMQQKSMNTGRKLVDIAKIILN